MEVWPGGPIVPPHSLRVDGREVELDVDQADLFRLVGDGDWWGVFPGSLTDPDAFTDRLLDPHDPLDLRDMWRVATELIGRLCGCEWWAGMRLAAAARRAWFALDGWCAARGVDPGRLPLHRLCALVYRWQLDLASSDKEVRKFHAAVFDPPARLARLGVTPWTREEEAASFRSTLAALTTAKQEVSA
jgi:hypothetical protein